MICRYSPLSPTLTTYKTPQPNLPKSPSSYLMKFKFYYIQNTIQFFHKTIHIINKK